MIRLVNVIAAIAVIGVLTLSISAHAASSRSSFGVSVTVLPVAHMNHDALNHIVITRDDVQRGYVDVKSNSSIQVSSNSAQGFALDVYPICDLFNNVVISGVDGDVSLSADGGSIVHRWSHAQTQALSLSYRFSLHPDIQPGIYSFPLQMSVRPL